MKKIISLIILIALGVTGYFYRQEIKDFSINLYDKYLASEEKIPRQAQKISRGLPPRKEIEVFTIGTDETAVYFTKSGISSAQTFAYIVPQTTGRVIGINTKIGDHVRSGELLITLGDSLATDIADTQYNTAAQGYSFSLESQNLTALSGNQTLQAANLGLQMAQAAYENTQNARDNTETIFEDQIESAENSLDNLEDNYDDAKDNLNDAEETLNDLEDQYNELSETLSPSDPVLQNLQNSISQIEGQIKTLESAKDQLKDALEQAEDGITQLENTRDSQLSQLDFGIESASLQYQTALSQMQSANYGVQQQGIGSAGQVLQSGSGLEMAILNKSAQSITSPIDGVITEVQAEENNLVSPGQILAKVEDLSKLSIITSINADETKLISEDSPVKIMSGPNESNGTIKSISPVANETTKKFDVEIEIKAGGNFTAGEIVDVKFIVESKDKIFIPLNSVFINGENKYVKKIDEHNIVQYSDIETGEIVGEYIEIISGLNENDQILRPSTAFVEKGDKVKIVKN